MIFFVRLAFLSILFCDNGHVIFFCIDRLVDHPLNRRCMNRCLYYIVFGHVCMRRLSIFFGWHER